VNHGDGINDAGETVELYRLEVNENNLTVNKEARTAQK